ncbi:hypothetical protein V1264_007215 [Littorina saxatilis]
MQIFTVVYLLGLSLALQNVHCFFVDTAAHPKENSTKRKHKSDDGPVVVKIELGQSLNTISPHFVGVNIDSDTVRYHWQTLDFSSQKLQNLARALSPSYLRMGGTSADGMNYFMGNATAAGTQVFNAGHHVAKPPFNITADQWVYLNEFLRTVSWDFIFDLNALKRNADGSWDPDNARQLLQFSADRNYTIAGFELGNEFDIYRSEYDVTVAPAQLAQDVMTLQKLLTEFPKYKSSFIIGPETAYFAPEYFQAFLAAGGYKAVHAASFHHYYLMTDEERNLQHFTDIDMMDTMKAHLDEVFAEVRSVDPQLPVWLSETSSANNGGLAGLSDAFVAGFLWLDKLGVCAVKGVETVMRQAFYGRDYSLVDGDLNPNPDFWLTVLYKRIVRGAVFNATGRHDVRVYAACANTDNFKAGSLVVYMLNPNNYSVTFDLPQFQSQSRLVYSLTPGDSNGLISKFVSLNGVKLELVNDELPDLKPESAPPGVVTMDPYSYIFVVFPEAKISICLH